jgi:Zn-finger nucleic acid-binding protein
MCRIEVHRIPVHTCPDCGGELVEELRLKALQRRADPDWTEDQRNDFCRLADASNDLREVACPRCARVMRKFLFRNYANLQLDQCPECRIYWLDAGEMEKLQILHQDDLATRTDEDWDRIEKMAVASMAAETRKAQLRDWVAGEGRRGAPGPLRPGVRQTPAGALLSLLGLVWARDRDLARIADEADETVEAATFKVPTVRQAKGHAWHGSQKAILLLLLLGALCIAGGIWWLLR